MSAEIMKFLAMGGYAQYVWPSYGLVIAIVILNVVWARRALRRAREEARRRVAMKKEPA